MAEEAKEEGEEELSALYKEIKFVQQDIFNLVDENVYELVHDKGTFDVVVMNEELSNEEYVKAVAFRMK